MIFNNKFIYLKMLKIEQFNRFVELNIIMLFMKYECYYEYNYNTPMMVQYLTVLIEINSTQHEWAVIHQYLILLHSRS